MKSEVLKNQICVAAGVQCPLWLRKITRECLLEEIRDLVTAGVLLVNADAPHLSPLISEYDSVRYGARAAMLIECFTA